jgi:VIT1/CCC1 family predicted Fe2+/Mn2+ transporter/rubrerythrin
MSKDAKRYLRYLAAEREASTMYRQLAELSTGDPREALLELASIEDKHASHWERLITEAGVEVPANTGKLDPDSERLVARARTYSLQAVLADLEEAERDAQGTYDDEPNALPGMAEDERLHAQVLAAMMRKPDVGHDRPEDEAAKLDFSPAGRSIDEVRSVMNQAESWHRVDKSGSLRATVFGASDGLVSNTALVMGFAGSGIATGTVLFAGIAGLLAGAFSMGAGEYVSVASQRDLFAREIAMEAEELREKPLEEQRELELIYRAKGLDRETAKKLAETIMSNPETALDTLAREELGLDPDDLGSPVKVAASSFVAFSVGAAVPVIPYIFAQDTTALIFAIVFAALALVAVGGTVGYLSGAGIFKSAMRQLIVGAGAAAVTYIIGSLVGVGLG